MAAFFMVDLAHQMLHEVTIKKRAVRKTLIGVFTNLSQCDRYSFISLLTQNHSVSSFPPSDNHHIYRLLICLTLFCVKCESCAKFIDSFALCTMHYVGPSKGHGVGPTTITDMEAK